MSRRIEVSFSGGDSDVVFSGIRRRFFSYEKDRNLLHQLYGGENYYVSSSGLTGKGYLAPSLERDDLIVWGHYLIDDRKNPITPKKVGFYQPYQDFGSPSTDIYGYVPVAPHKGIDDFDHFPFVLSDGETVAFLQECEIPGGIRNWGKIKEGARTMSLQYFVLEEYGKEVVPTPHIMEWGLYNREHLGGVDALKFLFFGGNPKPRCTWGVDEIWKKISQYPQEQYPRTALLLNVAPIMVGGQQKWVSKHPYGFFDKVFDSDPRQIDGELGIGKLIGDGNGVIWRRKGLQVKAFIELSWAEFKKENDLELEYEYEGHPLYIDYSVGVPVMSWFSMTKEQRRISLIAGMRASIQEDLDRLYRKEATGHDQSQSYDQKKSIDEDLDI